MKVTIKITHNNSSIKRDLTGFQSLSIGRSSNSTCQIDDDRLSGLHCKFSLKKEKLEVTDLNSKNGTYLNGIKVSISDIFLGDEIKIGSTTVTLDKFGCDEDAIKMLEFKGDSNDRMDYLLKTDVTAGRVAPAFSLNQEYNSSVPRSSELPKRKTLKGKVKQNKYEIRARHKSTSALAAAIDIIATILIFLLPILGVATAPIETKEARIYALVGMEILCLSSFILVNFKVADFTIGEKLSGIRELFYSQK